MVVLDVPLSGASVQTPRSIGRADEHGVRFEPMHSVRFRGTCISVSLAFFFARACLLPARRVSGTSGSQSAALVDTEVLARALRQIGGWDRLLISRPRLVVPRPAALHSFNQTSWFLLGHAFFLDAR